MDYFEQYPWLLIVVIIVTVEVWNFVKAFIMAQMANMNKKPGR